MAGTIEARVISAIFVFIANVSIGIIAIFEVFRLWVVFIPEKLFDRLAELFCTRSKNVGYSWV